MSRIINAALGPIQTLIGGSQGGAAFTELDDQGVTQTLPIVPDIARRGLSQGSTGGWFLGILENVHALGDGEQSSIDPYNPGDDSAGGAYPASVPPQLEVWLCGISGFRSVGNGGLTMAMMGYNPSNNGPAFGWGRDDQGASVAPVTPNTIFARFDDLSTEVTQITQPPMITERGDTFVRVNMRLPRAGVLNFFSESAAAAEFQAVFLLGLFPIALGQDVLT